MDSYTESLLRNHSKEVFTFYLKAFNQNKPLIQGRNFSNPFLKEKQKTPSFNIYFSKRKTTWLFHDFATGDHGNCIELVKRLFNLSFKDAIEKIKTDFPSLESPTAIPLSQPLKANVESAQPSFTLPISNDFTAAELEYWEAYGVSMEILKKYQVFAFRNNLNGNPTSNSLAFAYKYGSSYKVYNPFSLSNRFYFKGSKPENFYFGFDQLSESGEYVIITGGEKDVLSLNAHGFPAICLNSETALPSNELVSELSSRFDHVIILYDNDETGMAKSHQLAKDYQFIRVELPKKEGLKDISDFFKAKFTAQELEALINDAINQKTVAAPAKNVGKWANLSDSPIISESTYLKMPNFMQDICLVHKDPRSRDVALLSALPLLSGCLPNIQGVYHQRIYSPHLYTFIIAPAASGKGNAGLIRLLGDKIESSIRADNNEAYKRYKDELQLYKRSKDSSDLPEPIKPKFKSLFLPGNTSSAALLIQLEQNDGRGIIFESEADSAGNAFKNEWGNYSDMLRKAYHHESISCQRKADPPRIEVPNPALAMCLTSTISQVGSIIKSAEDGLFSRIIFYAFFSPPCWMDVSPSANTVNLNQHYMQLGDTLKYIYAYYSKHPSTFDLTTSQWAVLNERCTRLLKEVATLIDDNATSIVKRLGLVWFRIAMLFTAIRTFEDSQHNELLICSESDFQAAWELFEVLFEHSKRVYINLPSHSTELVPGKQKLYDLLPIGWFSSKDAELHGKALGLAGRTVRGYIREFCQKGLLKSGKLGQYYKPAMSGLPGLPGLPGMKVA